jgi:hypothetical protein
LRTPRGSRSAAPRRFALLFGRLAAPRLSVLRGHRLLRRSLPARPGSRGSTSGRPAISAAFTRKHESECDAAEAAPDCRFQRRACSQSKRGWRSAAPCCWRQAGTPSSCSGGTAFPTASLAHGSAIGLQGGSLIKSARMATERQAGVRVETVATRSGLGAPPKRPFLLGWLDATTAGEG